MIKIKYGIVKHTTQWEIEKNQENWISTENYMQDSLIEKIFKKDLCKD